MMWWQLIAADQKVYVTYSGSDLDDAAGNQVMQFTKLVDVSGLSTANAATSMRNHRSDG